MSESRSMAYLIEAEGLFKRSDRRMGARKRSDETLKAMNNHHAVVEGVKLASSPSMALTLERLPYYLS